jgi:hypothetical protein|uniref:hypothetical protein n=1 Tax=Prosthecobacter sp. TaxID=1965333 RepID=UPI0037841A22
MTFTRTQRLTLGLIALLAIGWAQTFGLHRGWLCDHCEGEHITQVDHCHGPHSTAEHDHDDHNLPHDHDETDGDTHPLPAVIDSLLAKQQNSLAVDFTAPALAVAAEIIWDITPRYYFLPQDASRRSGKPPDWPHRLSQTIALRI